MRSSTHSQSPQVSQISPRVFAAENILSRRWIRCVVSGRLVWWIWAGLCVVCALIFFAARIVYGSRPLPVQTPRSLAIQFQPGVQAPQLAATATPRSNGEGVAPDAAGAGGEIDPDVLQAYLARIVDLVDRAKRYPRREKEERVEGVVVVRVAVDRAGRVTAVRLLAGSSRAGFNQEALAAVQRAAPFPPMPPEISRDQVQLQLRLRFVMR